MAERISRRTPKGWTRYSGELTPEIRRAIVQAFGSFESLNDEPIKDWAIWLKGRCVRRIDAQIGSGEIYSWRDGTLQISLSLRTVVKGGPANG